MPCLGAALMLTAGLSAIGVTQGRADIALDSFSTLDGSQEFRIIAASDSYILAATELYLFRLTPDLQQEEQWLFTSTSRLLVASNLQPPSSPAPSRTFEDAVLFCCKVCILLNATQFTNTLCADSRWRRRWRRNKSYRSAARDGGEWNGSTCANVCTERLH